MSGNAIKTDWNRLNNQKDEEIDYSDVPPITEAMWNKGHARIPKSERQSVQIDKDIIDYFKQQDSDYELLLNEALRKYIRIAELLH